MTITFIGHGYVGLVTACVFADFGNQVWVVGHTKEKIDKLIKGDPMIYEPGLKEILEKNLKTKRIHFTLSFEAAVPQSDIIFIAVGTPPKQNGEADLSIVFSVAEKIGKNLKKGFTVVSCKSTVPVGTNFKVKEIIDRVKPKQAEVQVASCPEFLRESTGVTDSLKPDRVVIGSESKKAINLLLNLHQPLPGKKIVTNLASAELIKYTANAMLATKISFANLISFYCEKTGADVETVLDAVGLDHRIGRVFLSPGVGYGGSCLPKDVKAIINIGQNLGIDTSMFESVEKINQQARISFLNKISHFPKTKNVAIWGLAFKPDTDDIREAPSIFIIKNLLQKKMQIRVYDQKAAKNVEKVFEKQIFFSKNPYEAVKNADILLIVTEWNEFKQIDLQKVKSLMNKPVIIDGRNLYKPEEIKKLGFTYIPIGRKS